MATVWKIAPGNSAYLWPELSEQGCITINFLNETNLSQFETREELTKALMMAKETDHRGASWDFAKVVQRGDTVVANNGQSKVVGIGVVESDYLRPDHPDNPRKAATEHCQVRLVKWVIDKPVDLHENVFGLRVTPTMLRLNPDQCSTIKQAYLKEYPELKETLDKLLPEQEGQEAALKEPGDDMNELLKQIGQIIVYGPPGTGKTREAKRIALALLTGKDSAAQAASTDDDIEKQLEPFREAKRLDLVVFHPAYEYEQFVGGIEPTVVEKQLTFKAKAGVFTRLCRKAESDNKLPVVLIIDEINRGNLPKLLGELIYALEYRGHKVRLPFDDGRSDLVVPKNLYVIATMNSADRSIGHIDVAIRRRFGLYPMPARPEVVQQVWSKIREEPYGNQLAALMERVNKKLVSEHNPIAAVEQGVGHSYFLSSPGASGETAKKQVQMKWVYQVQPLLREYDQLLNLGADSLQEFFKPLDDCLT